MTDDASIPDEDVGASSEEDDEGEPMDEDGGAGADGADGPGTSPGAAGLAAAPGRAAGRRVRARARRRTSARPKQPKGAIPPLAHLAKIAPALRGLSLDVSSLLTFTSDAATTQESEELELSEELSPPSVHYLLQQTHHALKGGLAGGGGRGGGFGGGFGGRPSAAAASAGAGGRAHQDLAAMELKRTSPSELLRKLAPALGSLPAHMRNLASLTPSTLSDGAVVDHEAAFGVGREDERLACRFAEPALLLAMQTLRLLVESRQLHDDASQRRLLAVLRRFGGAPPSVLDGGASQAPASSCGDDAAADGDSPAAAAAACAAAFDFCDTLFSSLPSIALQSELIELCRALAEMLARRAPGSAELGERRERLAALADACLLRERADDRALEDWSDKPPNVRLVKGLFEVQAGYCADPSELLALWASERLPELHDREGAPSLTLDDCPLFTKSSAPAFIGILFGVLADEAKKLPLPPPEAWKASGGSSKSTASGGGGGGGGGRAMRSAGTAVRASYAGGAVDAEEAASLLERLGKLADAFVQLVLSTKVVETKALNKTAISASVRFIQLINKRGLPMMSCHFKALSRR